MGTSGANNPEAVVRGNRDLLTLTTPATTFKTARLHSAAKAILGVENGSPALITVSHGSRMLDHLSVEQNIASTCKPDHVGHFSIVLDMWSTLVGNSWYI